MAKKTGQRRRRPSLPRRSGTAVVTLLNFQFARNKINEIHVASAQVSTATSLVETDTQAWHETAHSLIISIAALPARVTETRSHVSDSLEASVFQKKEGE